MKNHNTKYWAFTWQTNVDRKKLPTIQELKSFLDKFTELATFQEEKGEKAGKIHYQGCFTLLTERKSKTVVLAAFKERFGNAHGLILSKVYDKDAILSYTTKQETRISGPYYCGSSEFSDQGYISMKLKPWQQDLYNLILDVKNEEHPDYKLFRDRYIIWVSDPMGGSGKSEFVKWLRIGQNKVETRKLPIDSVDRLVSAVVTITKQKSIDLFVIDDTRTQGKETNFEDMFEAIETIKNGHTVSCMYGKYMESIFRRPILVFFTNKRVQEYIGKLSRDRWYPMMIENNNIFPSNEIGVSLRSIEIVMQMDANKKGRAVDSNSTQTNNKTDEDTFE